jgi:Protein of unknown function (DUF3631)
MKALMRERLVKLFAMLGSDNAGERENARTIIDEILRKNRKTWNDLVELLQTGSAGADWNIDDDAAPSSQATGANVSALDLVHGSLEQYLELKQHEYVAVALWTLHTHIFNQFQVTPRLMLVSPVRGCGKTAVLDLLVPLTARGRKDDGPTAAVVIRWLDREHPTLLLDEVDNYDLAHNGTFRSVINSGHRRGGSHSRLIKNEPRRFSLFAPMAIATIGALPLPIMHRSIVIHMERSTRSLHRFLGNDPAVDYAYGMVRAWAREAKLNPDPELPSALRNRPADNWRVLISIADSFGPKWGARAREAAVNFARAHRDEDAAVTLLNDILGVFDDLGVDRLTSAKLVEELVAMDDAGWAEWRGLEDNQQPRQLAQGELARLLAPFGIRPRTVWPQRRNLGSSRSQKGYLRSQFESTWHKYCDEPDTPSQHNKFSKLRRA